MRLLHSCLGTGNFNRVIQPTPGIYDDDDDLYTFDMELQPDGSFSRKLADPVEMSEAQGLRLSRRQCWYMVEFLRTLNERDAQFLRDAKRYDEGHAHTGRRIKPGMPSATHVVEGVAASLPIVGGEPTSPKTLLTW